MNRNLIIALSIMMTLSISGLSYAGGEEQRGKWNAFYGYVEKMPIGLYGTWIFNGRTVRVSPQTRVKQIHGLATPGSYAEIMGISRGGIIYATYIEIEPGGKFLDANLGSDHRHENGNLSGTIKELPQSKIGHWKIDGHRVLVDKRTQIEETQGQVLEGAGVSVEGYYRNSTFYAQLVEVK